MTLVIGSTAMMPLGLSNWITRPFQNVRVLVGAVEASSSTTVRAVNT
ncbi:hypothetical protein PFLUOLIPICF7_21170 [Pseudomonas simiae]|nr:hypothetical protein PFLUOLIPICF7_21170 [Pseudomonas simiae]